MFRAQTSSTAYLGNNRSGADCAALADRAAGKDYRTASNPAIRFNNDWFAELWALAAHPPLRIDGKRRRVNTNVGPNVAVVSNLDLASVRDGAIPSNDHVLPDSDIVPIVADKWRLHHHVFPHAANIGDLRHQIWRHLNRVSGIQDLTEEPRSLQRRYSVGRVHRVVEPPASRIAPLPLQHELLVERVKVPAGQHFLLLSSLPTRSRRVLSMCESELRRNLGA